MIEPTEQELKIVEIFRKLRPHGKIEISMNQDGTTLSIYLTNPQKVVIVQNKGFGTLEIKQ